MMQYGPVRAASENRTPIEEPAAPGSRAGGKGQQDRRNQSHVPLGVGENDVNFPGAGYGDINSGQQDPGRQRGPVAASSRKQDRHGQGLDEHAHDGHDQGRPLQRNQQRQAGAETRHFVEVAGLGQDEGMQPSKVIGLCEPDHSIFRIKLRMRQKAGTAAKQRDQHQSEDHALLASTQAVAPGECFLLRGAGRNVREWNQFFEARSSRSGKTDTRMLLSGMIMEA